MASARRVILAHPGKQVTFYEILHTTTLTGFPGSQERSRTAMTSYRHKAHHRSDVVLPLNYLTILGSGQPPRSHANNQLNNMTL